MKYCAKIPFIRIWANIFVFKGKEKLKDFLIDYLLYLIFVIGFIVCLSIFLFQHMDIALVLFLCIFVIYYIFVFPLLALFARRFYTVGANWKLCFIVFIPCGVLWTTIAGLSCRSEEEANGKSYDKRVKKPLLITAKVVPPSFIGLIFVVLFVSFIVALSLPPTTIISTDDYQIIFNLTEKYKTGESNIDIIGFGEYKYNSYLLLVPRETPSTLDKFYYRYESGGFDVSDYSFYFECKLEQEKYDNYVKGLEDFAIKVGDVTKKLIKTDDTFDYPAYVAQWRNSSKKWQVLEYIMLDSDEHRVIYAFSMSYGYDEIVANASCNIAPKNGVNNVPEEMNNFSIYRGTNGYYYKLSRISCDTSFLSNLL